MIASARARVAVAGTALFAAVVLASAAGVYWLIQGNAYWRLDQTLRSTMEVASLTLFEEGEKGGNKAAIEEGVRHVFGTSYLTAVPLEQIVIWDGNRMVAYKKNLGTRQGSLLDVATDGTSGIRNHVDLRIETRQVFSAPARTNYTIAVSTWRGDVMNDMRSVMRALAITIPAALLFAAIGGYILAKQALAPLIGMAASVDAITSQNLEQRVPVVNSYDEVGQLAIRFNKLLGRLQAAFEQQRRFMADAAHELKTPITAALTAAQVTLVGEHRSEPEYREALRITEEQMSRLKHVVQDMFLLAQVDANAMVYRRETVYLDEIVAEGFRAMYFLAQTKNLDMRLAEMPELRCTGDPGLLRQAVINLLDNARKYTDSSGSILVSAEVNDESFVLRIADTGPGVPESARGHLFERFYRPDKARARSGIEGGGAGLGLAIAKWVADVHHGDLRLESTSTEGSTFAFEIPRG